MTEPQPRPEALAKAYVPAEFEHEIYERWLAADVFAPDGAGSTADWALEPFVIIQPPPNVTGSLHLGHAQRTTVEDLMTRHARMVGRPSLFLPGLDHASIAAQFVLDGILAKEGESRASLGRERYLERMHAFIEETRTVILTQQRRIGGSCDWGRLRFTMDDGERARRPRGVPAPVPARPRVPRRGARQLVPRLPDQRQRPRGAPDTRDAARSGASGTTWWTRRRASRTRTRRSPWPRRVRRRSWATPRSRCIPTTRATPPWWAGGCGSRSWSATCRSSPTRSWTRHSAPVP